MVAGQKTALGRIHAGQIVTVLVFDTALAVEFSDGETQVVNRTTTQPVRSIKGQRAHQLREPYACPGRSFPRRFSRRIVSA